ncbi:cache domain-containing sensor histidine kinase [Lachnoclostridium sp. Marseille-P6806]|uniref:cache domain-containing sensor histidine kinase n=1 Tax=Lachnoclostridium sp. Marseille-P6806 TaxID=2364793 RepID=UPI0010307902|nr:sensor histidine kinase [Lachnoclostridium sp. Marseille-P6806]
MGKVCRGFGSVGIRIKKLAMWKKMLIAYSIPLILLIVAVMSGAALYLEKRTERDVRNGAEQAQRQAESYISSRIGNMNYVMQQILTSYELRELLAQIPKGKKQGLRESYAEFFALSAVLQRIEFNNDEYRVGMYVPDSLVYSSNNYLFYPEASFLRIERVEELEREIRDGKNVYRILQDKRTGDPSSAQAYLTLLSMIRVTDGTGTERGYPVKAGIRLAVIRQILRNGRTIEGSLLYLADEDGHILAATDEGREQALARLPFPVSPAENWTLVTVEGQQYYSLHRSLEYNDWEIVSLIPLSNFRKQFLWLFLLMGTTVALLVAAVAVISYIVARYYSNRISFLNGRMGAVQSGAINTRTELQLPGDDSGDEMDELYRNFDFMIEEVQKLMKEQYRLGRMVSETEMKALQAQINPHFLYNTLDLINWGAMDYGAGEVAALARDLGQFYRISLNHGRSVITIGDELRHVRSFVSIENAHYGNAIHCEMDVPEEIREYACLNITLQPFVENSIVHGIGEHTDIAECHIRIAARREGEDIVFTVEDDGPGIDADTARNIVMAKPGEGNRGFGIGNVNFRIKLCYGDGYGAEYMRTEKASEADGRPGTCVSIRIRALYERELETLLGQ